MRKFKREKEFLRRMEQRELYIVRAGHFNADSIPSLFDLASQTKTHSAIIASARIVHDIVTTKLITGFFGDGITENVAREMNEEIERDQVRKEGGMNKLQRTGLLSLGGFFNVKEMMMALSDARSEGSDVRVYETEPWYVQQYRHLMPIELKVLRYLYEREREKYATSEEEQKSFREYFSDASPLLKMRDARMYKVIKESEDYLKILLQVGRAHRLRDFYTPHSGFSVVGITLEENLEYKLDFANRAEVPANIKEIVEQNIAQARA